MKLPPFMHRGATYDAVLVVVDKYTKYAVYIPTIERLTAPELATILFDEILNYTRYTERRKMLSISPSKGISKVLQKHEDRFREELPPERPPTRSTDHRIDTGDAKPVNINAYPLNPIHLIEQRRQMQEMLEKAPCG